MAGETGTKRLWAGAPALLWLLVLILLAICVGSMLLAVGARGTELGPLPLLVVFVGLFAASEIVQVHLHIRRQTYAFSIAEIPLVLGLFYLGPLGLLLSRQLGILITLLTFRRTTAQKLIFNIAVFAAEVAIVMAVFVELGASDPAHPMAWLAWLVAIEVGDILSACAVMAAITIVEGRPDSKFAIRTLFSAVTAGLLNTTVGLIVLIVLQVTSWSAVLLLILAAVLIAGYRAYAQFQQQHKSLADLYEFTNAIGTARQESSLADELLTRTRRLLNAESASLWLPSQGRYPELLLAARVDSPGLIDDPLSTADAIRERALKQGRTVLVGPKSGDLESDLRPALRARKAKDIIAVPLRSGGAVIGCLEVVNRLGDLATFKASDVQLLETLAAHAAVAVENSRLVNRLRHDAYHDSLTGLPNRRRLLGALEAAINVQPAPGEVVALLQFDVDSLRDVNETLGHVAGDRLLVEVGRRLQTEAPKGALVARIGGDEFAVLIRAQGAEGAQAIAVALQYVLIEPLELDSLTLDIGAAVGIALYPDHGTDAEAIMQRVDVATYTAKTNPRSIQLYRPAMDSRSVHRLGLVSELRRAIEEGALTVHYQPKVGLADRELIGVECLVRWEHPEHGLVSPDDFIPVAEHTGLVGALTSWVLRVALEQCKAWNDAGRPIGVSVNLSTRTLLDSEFPDELERLLAEIGLPPNLLTLEITESGMVGDADRPLPSLRRLHSLGVRLAVDDFGIGYSSLAYLRHLPVHEVKIDKSFVLGMATDSGDLAIVRAIVDLGRHLGLTAVAEGVESEMTLALLENMGCDVAQGFLFSRPLPRERIEAWMAARTELTSASADGDQRLRVVTG